MLTIRDIKEEDRQEFFAMAKEFYGGPACDHDIPEEHFERTLQECLRSREYSRTLMLEDENGVAGYFLIAITWSNEAGGMVIWLDELFFKEQLQRKRVWNPGVCMGGKGISRCKTLPSGGYLQQQESHCTL